MLQYERIIWEIENNGGETIDELTLDDPNMNYLEINLQNGINKEMGKEISNQIKKEKESISKYGGYYIGRYETGNQEGKAVIKKNQEPYLETKWIEAYEIAKNIEIGNSVESYLCSSYAWDTAINFIQNSGIKDYAISREEDFNENWIDKEVRDEKGNIIKPRGTCMMLKTGSTTAKNNIYDMAANASEYTTEINPENTKGVIVRGSSPDSIIPAGRRSFRISSIGHKFRTFRITLFLK